MEDAFSGFTSQNDEGSPSPSPRPLLKVKLGRPRKGTAAPTACLTEDDKKGRRRAANRESARRMRARRAETVQQLSEKVEKIQTKYEELQNSNHTIRQNWKKTALENRLLRAELTTLQSALPGHTPLCIPHGPSPPSGSSSFTDNSSNNDSDLNSCLEASLLPSSDRSSQPESGVQEVPQLPSCFSGTSHPNALHLNGSFPPAAAVPHLPSTFSGAPAVPQLPSDFSSTPANLLNLASPTNHPPPVSSGFSATTNDPTSVLDLLLGDAFQAPNPSPSPAPTQPSLRLNNKRPAASSGRTAPAPATPWSDVRANPFHHAAQGASLAQATAEAADMDTAHTHGSNTLFPTFQHNPHSQASRRGGADLPPQSTRPFPSLLPHEPQPAPPRPSHAARSQGAAAQAPRSRQADASSWQASCGPQTQLPPAHPLDLHLGMLGPSFCSWQDGSGELNLMHDSSLDLSGGPSLPASFHHLLGAASSGHLPPAQHLLRAGSSAHAAHRAPSGPWLVSALSSDLLAAFPDWDATNSLACQQAGQLQGGLSAPFPMLDDPAFLSAVAPSSPTAPSLFAASLFNPASAPNATVSLRSRLLDRTSTGSGSMSF